MAFLMEVIHTISPATKNNFTDYVSRYGEVAIPLMEENGYEVLGAWECLTGILGRDMLLVRCDSMGQFEEASAKIAAEIAAGRISRLQSLGLNMEEEVQYGYPLVDGKSAQKAVSRELSSQFCVCVRVDLSSSNYMAALEASKNSAQDSSQHGGYELAFSYGAASGRRGSYTEIWTARDDCGEMGQFTPFSPHAENETLLKLIDSMTVEILKPLPYSNIR